MQPLLQENAPDGIRRQLSLRQESRNGTCSDELGDVGRRGGRNQDNHRPCAAIVPRQQVRKVETALVAECQIDEHDVRPQLADERNGFSAGACTAEYVLALPLKKTPSDGYE
jgi:hypothetical protein